MAKTKCTPEYITVTDAAKILGVKKSYIYDLINAGLLPAYRPSPRKTIIVREELDNCIRSRQI